jgi:hypothetical protein
MSSELMVVHRYGTRTLHAVGLEAADGTPEETVCYATIDRIDDVRPAAQVPARWARWARCPTCLSGHDLTFVSRRPAP